MDLKSSHSPAFVAAASKRSEKKLCRFWERRLPLSASLTRIMATAFWCRVLLF